MAKTKAKTKTEPVAPDAPAGPSPTSNGAAPAPSADALAAPKGPVALWEKPQGLSRRGWAFLGAVVLVANFPVLHYFLFRSRPEAPVAIPYEDDFSRPERLVQNYWAAGGLWRQQNGELLSPGVKDNPLWLKAKLPQDVVVEFDVRSTSPEGDIKVEIFGDGTNHGSGYILNQGYQPNGLAIIARLEPSAPPMSSLEQEARRIAADQHLPSANVVDVGVYKPDTRVRVEARNTPVQLGKTYHWRIERRGSVLSWSVDGQPFMSFNDPFPLAGPDHDRFAFSSWEADLYFDNLRIVPLDGSTAAAPVAPPPAPKPSPGPFADSFDRPELGKDWKATDPSAVALGDGSLTLRGMHNHPVWLTKPIPEDAVIELDCWSDSPDGDIKVEIWGDGSSFHTGDPRAAYTATSYVFVFGGWRNTASVIARMQEHGADRVAREDVRVVPGHRYHWKITRAGGKLDWEIDGKPFLRYEDPNPLVGISHQHFAFSGWEAQVHFDNLRIQSR